MKHIAAFNGSPRAHGNTFAMLEAVCTAVQEQYEVDYTIHQVGGRALRGCNGCGLCTERQDLRCAIEDDSMNEYIQAMAEADVILIGSPSYFSSLTPETKALIDRCGRVLRGNGFLLKRKIGAAVSPARRAGAMNTIQSINNFFFINEMILPGSSYWHMAQAREAGSFADDLEGVKTMHTLGGHIAWLLERLS